MKRLVSVWLLFSEGDSAYLSKIIKRLAREYNAPEFYPHLTVYGGGLVIDPQEAKKITIDAVKEIGPFTVHAKKINFTKNNIWKTIFIETGEHPSLNATYKNLREKLLSYNDYVFLPHISLMYKKIPESTKIRIIKNLSLKKEYLIDSVGIASTQGTREDASQWKLLFRKKLES